MLPIFTGKMIEDPFLLRSNWNAVRTAPLTLCNCWRADALATDNASFGSTSELARRGSLGLLLLLMMIYYEYLWYIYRVTPKFSQDDVDYQDTKDAASSRFCRSLWPCAVCARCSCCAPKRADAAGVLAAVCGIRPLRPGRLWDGYRIDIPGSPRTQKVRPCLIHHDVPFEVPDLKRNASKGTLLYIASLIVSNREWSWAGS